MREAFKNSFQKATKISKAVCTWKLYKNIKKAFLHRSFQKVLKKLLKNVKKSLKNIREAFKNIKN